MYLGEVTRNVLLALVDAAPTPLLFNGRSSTQLNTQFGLDTAVMSEVEEAWQAGRVHTSHVKAVEGGNAIEYDTVSEQTPSDGPNTADVHFLDVDQYGSADKARLEKIRQVIINRFSIEPENVSLRDASIVRWAASLVARRAARMSACSIAAVLIQTGKAKLGGNFTPKEDHIVVGVDGRRVVNSTVIEKIG